MPILTLADIRPYLRKSKTRNGQIVAACPVCGDDHHLYVSEKNGVLLMYCQKCNARFEDIVKAFKNQGAVPTQQDEQPAAPRQAPAVIEEYDHEYKNPDGSKSYFKHRVKYADGSKRFVFWYCDESTGEKFFKKPPGCNNLYNLDRLEAAKPSETLYIVEGEKCVDSLVAHGFLATTANTGAQRAIKLSPTDARLLNKFTVRVMIPDNDDKGFEYVQAWPGAKVLNLKDIWPEIPVKGDIADYFAAGMPPEKISGYRWSEPVRLDRDYFEKLDKFQLISEKLFESLNAIVDPAERQKAISMATFRATALCMVREFNKCYRAYNVAQAQKNIRSANMTKFPQQLFSLNCGDWSADEKGVKKLVSQSENDFRWESASPIPVMPVEVLVNVEDSMEKLRLAYYKDGAWRSLVVPRSMLANNNKIINLADNGLEVNSDNAKLLVRFIADCVALNPTILPRIRSIGHLGWSDADFVPYTADIKLDCEEQYRTLIKSVSEAGDLEGWVDFVKPLRQNIYLRLILAASFASVLVEKVGALPFVLHLWGGTGSGKTVGMMVAASVWGNPRIGHMVRTMNMTLNSMMASAAVLRNLPFFGDELQTIKSQYESYDKLIMQVCEGVNRGRMNSGSEMQVQTTWCNAFVFTGEEPCTKIASGGGVKNRVIEIEIDGPVVESGNAVVNFINQNYGIAGHTFVDALKGRRLQQLYGYAFKALLDSGKTTEKQAMAMALIMVADDLADEIFFKTGNLLEINDVAPFLKTPQDVDPAERAFAITLDIMSANADKFGTEFHPTESLVTWGRRNSDGTILINKTILEQQLSDSGFEFAAVKKKWAEKEYLVRNSQGRYFSLTTSNGIRGNYVQLNPSKMLDC